MLETKRIVQEWQPKAVSKGINVLTSETMLQHADHLIRYSFPKETRRKIIEHAAAGYFVLLYSNHRSHADILAASKFAKRIARDIKKVDPKFNGFYLGYASSINTGDQGPEIKQFFNRIEPYVHENYINTLPVTRQADIDQYGITDRHLDSIKAILSAPNNHYGLAAWPEGTTKGSLEGMVPVDDAFGDLVKKLAKKTPILFVPYVIQGTEKLFTKGKKVLTRAAAHLLLDFVPGMPQFPLASARAGMPYTSQDMESAIHAPITEMTPEEINGFMMSQVGLYLPRSAQGVYPPGVVRKRYLTLSSNS